MNLKIVLFTVKKNPGVHMMEKSGTAVRRVKSCNEFYASITIA